MQYYLDITLLVDAKNNIAFSRNKVYDKLHKAMWDLKSKDIGVSFPRYEDNKLGNTIRIHSIKEGLEQLQELNWTNSLSDFCKMSSILEIPTDIKGYQSISRIRQTMNQSKLKKRIAYQQKKGVLKTKDAVDAYIKQYKAKMFATGLDNPYLEIQSTSTSNMYRIYIKFGEIKPTSNIGEFNNFGLSNVATIPIF